MTTVTGITGQLAARARYRAQTAVVVDQFTILATAYDQHVSLLTNRSPAPHCGHAAEPPYIVVASAEERAWCIECVKDALRNDHLPCEECGNRTEVYMFPFGEIVVTGNICQDCGGLAFLARPSA